MRPRIRLVALVVAAALAAPPAARGQLAPPPSPVPIVTPRTFAGGGLRIAQPVGQFRQYVDVGVGVGGHVVRHIDRDGILSLRVDGGFLIYGQETKHVPLSPYVGRVHVDVSTSNNIASIDVGPQLAVPVGPLRPYVAGTVGFSYFFTESSVQGSDDSSPFANTENFSDGVGSLGVLGGVLVPLVVTNGGLPVLLDLSAHYLRHGQTRYLREGSIQEDGNGNVRITPIQSETRLVLYTIGVRVGVR